MTPEEDFGKKSSRQVLINIMVAVRTRKFVNIKNAFVLFFLFFFCLVQYTYAGFDTGFFARGGEVK